MNKIKKYVVGFIFDHDFKTIYLIRKQRPQWQKGLLNGVGGKIEAGESPLEAMKRESVEECGLVTDAWRPVARLGDEATWEVFLFYTVIDNGFIPRTVEEEEIEAVAIDDISPFRADMLPNLPMLIGAVAAGIRGDRFTLEVVYARGTGDGPEMKA